jgi:hypothetical protein
MTTDRTSTKHIDAKMFDVEGKAKMTTDDILQKLSAATGPAFPELLMEMEIQCADIEHQRPGSLRLRIPEPKTSFSLRSGQIGIDVAYKRDHLEWTRFTQNDLRQLPGREKGRVNIIAIGGQTYFAMPGCEAFPDLQQTALHLINLLFD